jgi:hypothetical protein
MARRRMIDPGIWGSEDFNHLSHIERLLWIGLFSNADDYGYGRAAVTYLRSTIFPFEDIALETIEAGILHMAATMEVKFYIVGDAHYYHLTAWRKWQSVSHPLPSTIPEPLQSVSGAKPEPSQKQDDTGRAREIAEELKRISEKHKVGVKA